MGIADIWLIEFLTSDPVMALVKPGVVAFLILFMVYQEAKPRIRRSDKVKL